MTRETTGTTFLPTLPPIPVRNLSSCAGRPPVTAVQGAFRGSVVLTASAVLPQNLFLQFDADRSGTMSSYELRTALRAAGKEMPGVRVRADRVPGCPGGHGFSRPGRKPVFELRVDASSGHRVLSGSARAQTQDSLRPGSTF